MAFTHRAIRFAHQTNFYFCYLFILSICLAITVFPLALILVVSIPSPLTSITTGPPIVGTAPSLAKVETVF